MKYKLREYQIDGIERIKEHKNFGLFWQQRLGKTIVSILAVKDYKKVIFAVPNSILIYWYKEIIENIEGINCSLLPKNKKYRMRLYDEFNKCDKLWIVASYDTISMDILDNNELLSNADYLVLDESHFLRNRKSKRSKGILKLREKCQYCLALSGTPAVNTVIDILRIFKVIYNDKKYGNKYYYKKRYFQLVKNDGKPYFKLRPEMEEEWNKMINKLCDIKKVHDYLKWLPRSIQKNVYLELGEEQSAHYKKMLLESKRIISNSKEKLEHQTITQIMRLRQICLDPKILNIKAPSIKIDWLCEYINRTLSEEPNERIIVFTNFSSLFKKWDLKLNSNIIYNFLVGEQKNSDREKIIKDFQNGKIHVLFANIQVSSLGITLDRATISIFLEKSWDPTNNEQAAFRMVDTQQKEVNNPKLIINLICNNTIDEKILEVLNNKSKKTNMVYELKKYILE